jgi:hypothetical protein
MSTQQNWLKLCKSFTESPALEKVKFLGLLLWATTMAARATYKPGTEDVLHPKPLRRLAELAHRIAQFQLDILHEKERRFDEEFFKYVGDELSKIGCSGAVYDLIEPNRW